MEELNKLLSMLEYGINTKTLTKEDVAEIMESYRKGYKDYVMHTAYEVGKLVGSSKMDSNKVNESFKSIIDLMD